MGGMREGYSIIFEMPEDMTLTGRLGVYDRVILK
jgi:hypothetical protein